MPEPAPSLGPVGQTMRHQRFGDGLANREAGVQAGVGVLKNDLHLPAQQCHSPAVQMGNVLLIIEDLPTTGLDETQDESDRSSFPTAALTDQSKGFATIDVE